jgi:hypothetical protein
MRFENTYHGAKTILEGGELERLLELYQNHNMNKVMN